MPRERLADRRRSENFEFRFGTLPIYASVGYDSGQQVREVFLSTRKVGNGFDSACRDIAVLMSLLLQYGCPVDEIAHSLTREENGDPAGVAGIAALFIKERN